MAYKEITKLIRYYLVAFAALSLDQITKWAVAAYMVIGETLPIIPGLIYFTSHRNKGAAFGILPNQRMLFLVITVVVIIGIAVILKRVYRSNRLLSAGLALVMGGASGNFIDRLLQGEVVDMFELGFIDFPIFNVADCSIVAGVALIMLDSWKTEKKRGVN